MGLKISERRLFLSDRKTSGNRLTIGFAGIADLRSFIGLEYIKGMTKACIDYDINFINMGGAVKYSKKNRFLYKILFEYIKLYLYFYSFYFGLEKLYNYLLLNIKYSIFDGIV